MDIGIQRQAQLLADPLTPLILSRYLETGSWTPVVIGTGATAGQFAYGAQEGYYHRQGALLYCTCRVTILGVTVAPSAGSVRIVGLPPAYRPLSPDTNDLRVGQISDVALTSGRLGLAARAITESGQARIELSEYGNNVASAEYTVALLLASSGFDVSIAGRFVIDETPVGASAGLDFGTNAGVARGVGIGVL